MTVSHSNIVHKDHPSQNSIEIVNPRKKWSQRKKDIKKLIRAQKTYENETYG